MRQVSTVIFQNDHLRIGKFRCQPDFPYFQDAGPIDQHQLVFPRTCVRITHEGCDPVIANPNIVMFYNCHQQYQRCKLSERGDLCDWFAFHPQIIIDAVQMYEPDVVDRPDAPFSAPFGLSTSKIYLQQRLVIEHITNNHPPNHLYVEETVLHILDQTLEATYQARGRQSNHTLRPVSLAATRAHRALAQEAQTIMASCYQDAPSLTELAQALYTSTFHLCRIFRQQTGYTIQQYLDQLRLRTALESVADNHLSLTQLAIDLGYASHSHFTHAFKRAFGITPSQLRQIPSKIK